MVVNSPGGLPPDLADGQGFELDDDRREPTMTLTGWRRFVDAPQASFQLLEDPRWRALPPAERDVYDEARISYPGGVVAVVAVAGLVGAQPGARAGNGRLPIRRSRQFRYPGWGRELVVM